MKKEVVFGGGGSWGGSWWCTGWWLGVVGALAGQKLGGQLWGGGRGRRGEVGFLFFLLGWKMISS